MNDFFFARRRKDLAAVVVFDLADFRGEIGAYVDKLEYLQIELVDLGAEVAERRRHFRRNGVIATALGLARHEWSRGMEEVRIF